ncbi:MAG: hypothetical protein WCH62_06575, partial [Candidatus Omnitrophota bacterium]
VYAFDQILAQKSNSWQNQTVLDVLRIRPGHGYSHKLDPLTVRLKHLSALVERDHLRGLESMAEKNYQRALSWGFGFTDSLAERMQEKKAAAIKLIEGQLATPGQETLDNYRGIQKEIRELEVSLSYLKSIRDRVQALQESIRLLEQHKKALASSVPGWRTCVSQMEEHLTQTRNFLEYKLERQQLDIEADKDLMGNLDASISRARTLSELSGEFVKLQGRIKEDITKIDEIKQKLVFFRIVTPKQLDTYRTDLTKQEKRLETAGAKIPFEGNRASYDKTFEQGQKRQQELNSQIAQLCSVVEGHLGLLQEINAAQGFLDTVKEKWNRIPLIGPLLEALAAPMQKRIVKAQEFKGFIARVTPISYGRSVPLLTQKGLKPLATRQESQQKMTEDLKLIDKVVRSYNEAIGIETQIKNGLKKELEYPQNKISKVVSEQARVLKEVKGQLDSPEAMIVKGEVKDQCQALEVKLTEVKANLNQILLNVNQIISLLKQVKELSNWAQNNEAAVKRASQYLCKLADANANNNVYRKHAEALVSSKESLIKQEADFIDAIASIKPREFSDSEINFIGVAKGKIKNLEEQRSALLRSCIKEEIFVVREFFVAALQWVIEDLKKHLHPEVVKSSWEQLGSNAVVTYSRFINNGASLLSRPLTEQEIRELLTTTERTVDDVRKAFIKLAYSEIKQRIEETREFLKEHMSVEVIVQILREVYPKEAVHTPAMEEFYKKYANQFPKDGWGINLKHIFDTDIVGHPVYFSGLQTEYGPTFNQEIFSRLAGIENEHNPHKSKGNPFIPWSPWYGDITKQSRPAEMVEPVALTYCADMVKDAYKVYFGTLLEPKGSRIFSAKDVLNQVLEIHLDQRVHAQRGDDDLSEYGEVNVGAKVSDDESKAKAQRIKEVIHEYSSRQWKRLGLERVENQENPAWFKNFIRRSIGLMQIILSTSPAVPAPAMLPLHRWAMRGLSAVVALSAIPVVREFLIGFWQAFAIAVGAFIAIIMAEEIYRRITGDWRFVRSHQYSKEQSQILENFLTYSNPQSRGFFTNVIRHLRYDLGLMSRKITVVGVVFEDYIVTLPDSIWPRALLSQVRLLKDGRVATLLKGLKAQFNLSPAMTPGGIARNVVSVLRELGVNPIRFVTLLSQGQEGDCHIQLLQNARVDTRNINRSRASIDKVVCLTQPNANRREFICDLGASQDFRMRDISKSAYRAQVFMAAGTETCVKLFRNIHNVLA